MLAGERLAVRVGREQRALRLEERRRHVGREARLGVGDRVVRARPRPDEVAERRPGDAAELRVEPTPARNAVDVLRDGRLRERLELLPSSGRCGVSTSPKTRKSQPARSAGYDGHVARVQHRPLVRQVLAGREPRRVVPRLLHLPLRPAPEHCSATLVWMVATTLQVAPRPRSYVAVKGADAASYLNRMVSNEVEALRGRGVLRGAPPHAQGSGRRAADRLASGRRRLPPSHRARGRRAARTRAGPLALRGEVRDRARGAPLARRARHGRRRGESPQAALPNSRLRRAGGRAGRRGRARRMPRRSARTSSSVSGSSPAHRGSAASSTTA